MTSTRDFGGIHRFSFPRPAQSRRCQWTSACLLPAVPVATILETQREDLERFVNRESLVSIWPRLRRLLGPHAVSVGTGADSGAGVSGCPPARVFRRLRQRCW